MHGPAPIGSLESPVNPTMNGDGCERWNLEAGIVICDTGTATLVVKQGSGPREGRRYWLPLRAITQVPRWPR